MRASVYRRNDLLLRLTIKDDTGAALNLTGAALLFVARRRGGDPVIQKTVGDGITVIDAPAGEIEIDLTNADTDLPTGDYETELLVVDAVGHRYTAAQGRLTVLWSLAADIDVEGVA